MIVSTLNSGWGDAVARQQPLLRLRQEDRRRRSGSARRSRGTTTPTTRPRAVATVDGRRLLIVGGSDGTFHAHQGRDRRAGLAPRAEQARDPTSVAWSAARSSTARTARRTSTPARWGWWPPSTRTRAATLTPDKMQWRTYGLPGRLRLAGDVDAERLYQIDNGADARWPSTSPPARSCGTKTLGHDPEGLAGARRRQALRRHRERPLLHPEAEAGADADESSTQDLLGTDAAPEAIVASPAVAQRPRLRRVDGRALRDRAEGTPKATAAAKATPADARGGRSSRP